MKTLQGHADCLESASFSPDGKSIVSGSLDKTAKLWDVSEGVCMRTLEGHASFVRTVAFSPDSKHVASGSDDKTIKIWDVASDACTRTLEGHTQLVGSVAFSPDGEHIGSASNDRTVRLWRISDGECIRTLRGHEDFVCSVAFSPDGKYLASSGLDHTIRLWDVSTGDCMRTLDGHPRHVSSVSFSSDGRQLVSGSDDWTVRIWDVSSGACIRTFEGHRRPVKSVSFSPDDKFVLSGSADNTLRLWDVSDGDCIMALGGHVSPSKRGWGGANCYVKSVSFSPDGRSIVSAGGDTTLKVWPTTETNLDLNDRSAIKRRKMEHMIVHRDEDLYCAFPDVIRLPDGDLVVGFREAPRRTILSHSDPQSRAVLVRSRDGGKTWKDKTVIYDDENGIQDPSIMQLRDGTVISNFFKWGFRMNRKDLAGFEPISYDYDDTWPEGPWAAVVGTCVVRSFDGGQTWKEPAAQVDIPTSSSLHTSARVLRLIGTSAPALECADGVLLLPVYSRLVSEESADGTPTTYKFAFVVKSHDKGRTWQDPTLVALDPEGIISLDEPTLVQLESGKIICMMRAAVGGGDYLRQTESVDGGKTWKPFWKTPMRGHPSDLIQLADGRVLCAYGYRRAPHGVRACLSDDDGETWDIENEIVLRSDGFSGDLGYPSSVELSPGRILTVYYFHDRSETWFIAGTSYSV